MLLGYSRTYKSEPYEMVLSAHIRSGEVDVGYMNSYFSQNKQVAVVKRAGADAYWWAHLWTWRSLKRDKPEVKGAKMSLNVSHRFKTARTRQTR